MTNLAFLLAFIFVGSAIYCSYFPVTPWTPDLPAKYSDAAYYKTLSPHHGLVECIMAASLKYQLSDNVVFGVMEVEGGRDGLAAGPNANGTYDLGLMQINSSWIPVLAQLWSTSYTSAYRAVRDDECTNIFVGAWILKQKISKTGEVYSGVAAYHSATARIGRPYADKVFAAIERMQR